MCNWQVAGVQAEQNRCKDRALRKAATLGSPRTGATAHVHPETSISKQQTHQSLQHVHMPLLLVMIPLNSQRREATEEKQRLILKENLVS